MTTFWRTLGRSVKYYLLAIAGMHFLPAVAAFLHLSVVGIVFGAIAVVMATNSEKSRTTEDRISGILTGMGTMNTAVTNAQNTANNALPKTGGTVSGPLSCSGLSVSGAITATGDISTSSSLGVQGNVNWPGISMDATVADMCVTLAGGTYNATLTIYGSIGVNGNINYTGTLNHV